MFGWIVGWINGIKHNNSFDKSLLLFGLDPQLIDYKIKTEIYVMVCLDIEFQKYTYGSYYIPTQYLGFNEITTPLRIVAEIMAFSIDNDKYRKRVTPERYKHSGQFLYDAALEEPDLLWDKVLKFLIEKGLVNLNPQLT